MYWKESCLLKGVLSPLYCDWTPTGRAPALKCSTNPLWPFRRPNLQPPCHVVHLPFLLFGNAGFTTLYGIIQRVCFPLPPSRTASSFWNQRKSYVELWKREAARSLYCAMLRPFTESATLFESVFVGETQAFRRRSPRHPCLPLNVFHSGQCIKRIIFIFSRKRLQKIESILTPRLTKIYPLVPA